VAQDLHLCSGIEVMFSPKQSVAGKIFFHTGISFGISIHLKDPSIIRKITPEKKVFEIKEFVHFRPFILYYFANQSEDSIPIIKYSNTKLNTHFVLLHKASCIRNAANSLLVSKLAINANLWH